MVSSKHSTPVLIECLLLRDLRLSVLLQNLSTRLHASKLYSVYSVGAIMTIAQAARFEILPVQYHRSVFTISTQQIIVASAAYSFINRFSLIMRPIKAA